MKKKPPKKVTLKGLRERHELSKSAKAELKRAGWQYVLIDCRTGEEVCSSSDEEDFIFTQAEMQRTGRDFDVILKRPYNPDSALEAAKAKKRYQLNTYIAALEDAKKLTSKEWIEMQASRHTDSPYMPLEAWIRFLEDTISRVSQELARYAA